MTTSRIRLYVASFMRHCSRFVSGFKVPQAFIHSLWTTLMRLFLLGFCICLHYFWTPLILVGSALFVLICATFDFMNPLSDNHALAQLLDNCWMNDTNGSTDSGLQRMSEVLREHGMDAFIVDSSSMQSDFYPLVILLLLGQAISFHSIRFVWMLANYDDLYNLVNFIESSAFKRLNLRMNIDPVIEKIIPHFQIPNIIFLFFLFDILCAYNILFQNYVMEKFPGVNIIASVFSLESSFNSNWTAKCDYTFESHQPYFTCLDSIIYQCTPEKIFLLNSLSSNLDSPDVGNTVKELAKKVTAEHPIESNTYLFSISDPDEPV
ncbi:hypothetical protein TNCV_364691 [Trichonephila clavipes]|nr:hypothetical protein TNCV_364691 [Trichonephila clavipes]